MLRIILIHRQNIFCFFVSTFLYSKSFKLSFIYIYIFLMLFIKGKKFFFENKFYFMARIWILRILKNVLFQREKNLMISKEKRKNFKRFIFQSIAFTLKITFVSLETNLNLTEKIVQRMKRFFSSNTYSVFYCLIINNFFSDIIAVAMKDLTFILDGVLIEIKLNFLTEGKKNLINIIVDLIIKIGFFRLKEFKI